MKFPSFFLEESSEPKLLTLLTRLRSGVSGGASERRLVVAARCVVWLSGAAGSPVCCLCSCEHRRRGRFAAALALAALFGVCVLLANLFYCEPAAHAPLAAIELAAACPC